MRRRRRVAPHSDGRTLLQSLRSLWKAPAEEALLKTPQNRRALGDTKQQPSTATFATCVDDDEDETSASTDNDAVITETAVPTTSTLPQSPVTHDASPTALLQHYEARLAHAESSSTTMDWTERANLYYTTGCLHATLQHYEPATACFVQEARVLTAHGAPLTARVPIWRTCARLWQLRNPHRALHYYQQALECCAGAAGDGNDEAEEIRCDMGRLLFQTGHLEQAMRVSIGHR
jgi:hypothetical protein